MVFFSLDVGLLLMVFVADVDDRAVIINLNLLILVLVLTVAVAGFEVYPRVV